MNVDFHVHCNSNDPDEFRTFLTTCEKNETIAALAGGLHYGGHNFLPNEEVIALCRKYPHNTVPLAKIDLWDIPPDLAEARRYVDHGVRGFKFIYSYYEYDHESYMPLYEEIERLGIPVLFHTGSYRPDPVDIQFKRPILKNMSPIHLDTIARSFPNLHLVTAHMGTTFFREIAAELVKLHPNLYFDLAGNGSFLGVSPAELARLLMPAVFTRDMEGNHFRKLVFGSDAYVTIPAIQTEAFQAYRQIMLLNRISKEDQTAIFGNTVASWMKLDI
ncbi:MAG: Amidohydrolase [Lentisphaerae bacterium ADurb.Bin242]|nr:MAG: Amidohydrolase [Lentisphaerae bacterium ADurb.Bin242]